MLIRIIAIHDSRDRDICLLAISNVSVMAYKVLIQYKLSVKNVIETNYSFLLTTSWAPGVVWGV